MECCGGHSYVDFIESPYFNKTNPVPLSCCTLRTKDPLNPVPTNKAECFKSANEQDTKPNVYLHTTNCTGALENWLSSKTVILVSVAFAVAILQLLGIVFACCLRKEILGGEKF
uniref:Tetraspanin n=1 Tax=Capitella teleta TaxID=283909 RepID=X2AW03_CAPTE